MDLMAWSTQVTFCIELITHGLLQVRDSLSLEHNMLASTRVRTSAASRSVVARAMASSAPPTPLFTLVVKGKPETKQLLDCPFCHRVLLTLARKVGAAVITQASMTSCMKPVAWHITLDAHAENPI